MNFTDGNTHQVALYVVNWDNLGRAETVQVLDASNPGAPALDSRSIPNANSSSPTYTNTTGGNFQNGTYLIWEISGHVTIQVNNSGSPNAVVSGIFFGSPSPTAPVISSVAATTFTAGTNGTFTVTATGVPTPVLSANQPLPSGVSFVDNGNGTGTLSDTGSQLTATGSPFSLTLTASNGVSPAATQTFTLTVNPAVVNLGPAAMFVKADTTTQGNWMGVYGADGYDLANGPQSPANGQLSYGSYTVQNQSNWTWAASTSDPRALETDSQGDRLAATWYSSANFSFDVNFTDGNTHQLALYVMDWDSKGRAETIQIMDATSGLALDTRTVPDSPSPTSANFVNGTYLVWNISGHVTIKVTSNSGPNAVVSGIYF
jgi:hypothetical protein